MGETSTDNHRHQISPFLGKCYEMVDDEATNSIISWTPTDSSSFVIWDMIAFQQQVLPKYFKHGNFSSFMRQLNTYGFRKSDPDRWEFINDGFIKGQKQLLKNITRRKSTQSNVQQELSQETNTTVGTLVQQKQPPEKRVSVGNCVEIGNFKPWEEVENLKNDKNVLMQELVNLRQHQQIADNKLHRLRQRLSGMELNQQQMLSLLAMAVKSPGFVAQLLQQNESNWCISETSKVRALPALEQGTDCGGLVGVASDRRIVRYQPHINKTPNSNSNSNGFQQLDRSPNGLDELFLNIDMMSFAEGVSEAMEEDLLPENDGLFVFPELPEDDGMLDKLLLDSSPPLENGEKIEPEAVGNGLVLKSTNNDT